MNNYPLVQINKDLWAKKVSLCSMYTIPAEDDALPGLREMDEMLTRLITLPLEETLAEEHVEYFFVSVFPVACQKIIRSRYFKSQEVLKLSNSIIQNTVYLAAKYLIPYGVKYPRFLEILTIVFSTDQYYFKTNNQLSYTIYPYSYFNPKSSLADPKVGDLVDILKTGKSFSDKVSWSQGQILEVDDFDVKIAYLHDCQGATTIVRRDSYQLQPYKSKSSNFEWRFSLKEGDIVDYQDSFGSWYNGTITEVIEEEEGNKRVRIAQKVYDETGPRSDEKGNYYGMSDYDQILDVTSHKLQPYCTVAKQFVYESSKTNYDTVDDTNDYEFTEIDGEKVYAFPRKKYLSELLFQTINGFGRMGGFKIFLEYLQKQTNFDVLGYFTKGISGVCPYLHRGVLSDIVGKLRVYFQRHIFENPQKITKQFTKQRSEMVFLGLRTLQKRLYSNQKVYRYENSLKMKLVDSCLQSESLKKKLQGLNELKDIVKSVTYVSQKNKWIKTWVKENNIFEKIYIINSHVQLIKKSQDFFKYLINESILEVTDLERLYKMAQKGDYESRISLYKLFQEMSHIFKKQHVEYLIDTILESQLSLILNQDIDLLHELARYSNYFPMDKVISFFENIILGQNKVKQLNDYAIKKYSEIVAKNPELKSYRRNIIKNFLERMSTHDVSQVTKVLRGIFEGIGHGDWAGKSNLNEVLFEEKVDQVSINTIKKYKDHADFNKVVTHVLEFLLSIYKLTYKAKIYLSTMTSIWDLLEGNEEKQKEFYRWANDLAKCDQGIESLSDSDEFQIFFKKLFPSKKLKDIKGTQFELAKNLFIEVNKKLKYLAVSNTIRDKDLEKEYTRKVEMNKLRLIGQLIQMIYLVESETINSQVLHFFVELYNSKPNTQEQIDEFFNMLLVNFKNYYEQKEFQMVGKTIKLIEVVINDSEKNVDTNIESLTSKKKFEEVKFIIINETSYSSDMVKKVEKYLPMNMPVIRLRKMLAKEFNLTWQEVKIVGVKEIPDYQNSRTLKEIKLNPNTPLTVSRRVIMSQTEGELIIGDQMNPKVVRCFQVIFEKYSTNGMMNKEQCNGFTATCLGSNCTTKYYSQKITSLYNTYDDDNDGLLTFQNFTKFYEDAAKDRPSTVWSNLRSFGVKGDFRFNYEPEEEIEVKNYPRVTIAQEQKIYEILFNLLRVKGVAQHAFELLQRLPVSKEIEAQLLNISTEQDLNTIFDSTDHYELFYKLNVVEYLAYSNDLVEESEKQWQAKFIKLKGYEKLFACVQKLQFIQQEQEGQIDINKQILFASLCLLNEYWVGCFSAEPLKLKESIALIEADFQIDEKIEYLVTGSFPEKDQSLTIHPSTLPQTDEKYQWRGVQKSEITSTFLKVLKEFWDRVYDISLKVSYDEKFYVLSSIIFKLFDVLNVLLLNENPASIIDQISVLLDKLPSATLLSKLYCFIMCQCFYATEESKYQGVYIRELFKNLTKETITSEHFRVLAVLVSKFGLGTTETNQEESEETEKMKRILFENVSHNNNQLTVEGCAKLLCNFNLEGLSYDFFKSIWQERLFNPDTICQKKQTKDTLYELILKLCEDNENYTDKIIGAVKETIEDKAQRMKIVYCNEFKERSPTGFAGLKNLGNICYMNSMIQQLFMNKNFRYLLLRVDDKQSHTNTEVINKNDEVRNVDDNFLHQIQRIFAYLEKTNRIDFAPHDFCVAYKPFGEPVNIMIQQDVQEFISMFFDRLEMGLSKTPFKKLVHDFYLGKTVNLFKCHSCQKTKKVQENFHSISLEVKNSKSLVESFNKFNLGELINDYTCDFCNQKVDVSKKTRISKTPKILIIHLQRIVFNLDTFIEEKISNKHSFPHDFNLHQYTLDYYERKQANEAEIEESPDLAYSLVGIVCHTGNAAAGHYISYIKTDQNKWLEFNDSLVSSFNPMNIESECFGGTFATSSAYDDQYDYDRRETSKSAYLLIYEKKGDNTIEMVMDKIYEEFKNEETKEQAKRQFLKTMSLQEVVKAIRKKSKKPEKVEEVEQSPSEKQGLQTGDNMTNLMSESQGESSAHQDSETETKKLLQEKEREIKRHNSEDHIEENPNKMSEGGQKSMKKTPNTVLIQEPIIPYISGSLADEIRDDNIIHFIERCLSSESFTKFFASLLMKSHKQHQEMLPLCQKLTFGFWLKSPCFKDLLNMLDQMIYYCPSGFQAIIVQNPAIITLLIENSDSKIRSSMANFLAKAISDVLISKNVKMDDENIDEEPTIAFLDKLLSLLPTTVSKCWTKFSQYFEFWFEFSTKGEIAVDYMMKREVIKHFMDYFLYDKSPLKISVKNRQHTIGSSYASPNFSMLLKCISSLLKNRMEIYKTIKLSDEEEILIMSCESLEKLISDNYEAVACQLVKQLCPHNLFTSEKTALVILKGVSKSNYETIQPYLEVLHEFVMIEDEYQDLRIKWVVGKQTLAVSSLSKKIIAMNSYSYDERIYNFDSSINLESGASLLDPIFVYYKRIENYSFLCLRAALKLCNQSKKLRKFIFSLTSPTLSMSKYVDFFKSFIQKYFDDSKRVYSYYSSSSSGFNKEQLAKTTKQLYERVLEKVEQDQLQQKIEETKNQSTEMKAIVKKKCEGKERERDLIDKAEQNMKDPNIEDIQVIELKAKKKKSSKKQIKSQTKEKNEVKQSQAKDDDKVHDQNEQKNEPGDAQEIKIPVNSDEEEEKKKNPSDDDEDYYNRSNNSWEEQFPDLPPKSKEGKKNSDHDEYNIHVINQTGFMDLSSEEEEPLMKSKEESGEKSNSKQYKETWHPVKFQFIPMGEKNYMEGVEVTEHNSEVTFVITKPTGISNRSFTSSISSQKTIERILPETWENQKTEHVHGFFVRNTKRDNIRIQTDDGCVSCKGNDSCWVWANDIVKIFACEKTIDWPKWTLYPKQSE